jgi:multicomponent Na+:H+ antiporter subunit E
MIEIYKAGFKTIKMVFTKDINPGVIDIHTSLKNSHKVTILANSITLTPGTITIDKEDQDLKVLWIDVETRDPIRAGELIKGHLEKHL